MVARIHAEALCHYAKLISWFIKSNTLLGSRTYSINKGVSEGSKCRSYGSQASAVIYSVSDGSQAAMHGT